VARGPVGDIDPAADYPVSEVSVFDQPAWPKLYFIEKKFNGDESNWWFATRSCLKAMLRTAGFPSVQDTASPEIFVCRK
jgi:tRNA (mo5U34)-methyltransferase